MRVCLLPLPAGRLRSGRGAGANPAASPLFRRSFFFEGRGAAGGGGRRRRGRAAPPETRGAARREREAAAAAAAAGAVRHRARAGGGRRGPPGGTCARRLLVRALPPGTGPSPDPATRPARCAVPLTPSPQRRWVRGLGGARHLGGPKVLGSFSGQSCGGGSAAATARDSSQFRAAPALCATLGGVRLPRVEHSRCEARPARKIARAVPRVRTARCTDWHTAQEGLAFRARMWHRGTLSAARAGRGGGYAPQSHYGLCRQNPCAAGERARGASNGKRRDMEESGLADAVL